MQSEFDAAKFETLRRGRLGTPLRAVAVTGSTNSDALVWAGEGAPEGALVVADHQTAGRGRWGRAWVTEPGAALLFSLVLRPGFDAARTGLLTTALGVSAAAALGESAGVDARLKWPNDVVVAGRKLAGILVESRLTGARIEAAVAGVGVNLDWGEAGPPAEIAASATSVAAACGMGGREAPRREALLAAILASLEPLYDALATEDGRRSVVAAAASLSVVLGRVVAVRLGSGGTVEGRASGLDSAGALVIDTAAGEVKVDSGEVLRLRAVG